MSARLWRILVAYDIVDDRRRARLAKVLSAFGDRIQYSIFLIDLTPAKEVRLRARVAAEIDARVDSVLFCHLGPTALSRTESITYMGCRREVTDSSDFVL